MPSSRPVSAGDHVFLVDGSSFIFRAYFQSMNQPEKYNTRTSDGMPTGAVRLFCSNLLQLVGPLVRFYDFESGQKGKPGYRPERNLDEAAVTERWEGLPPDKIGDVLALMGDASDNVPGVPGIGLKTAAQLIKEYGDLETLLARAPEIKQPKRRESLIENADKARLSRQLVTLDCEAPLPVPLDDLTVPQPDPKALIGFLKAMEFNALTRRVAEIYGADAAVIEPDPRILPGGAA